VPSKKSVLVAAIDVAPAIDTLLGDHLGAVAPSDAGDLGAFTRCAPTRNPVSRDQLLVTQRTRPRRLRLVEANRWLGVLFSRFRTEWRTALLIVKPETVTAWH
jgi:hypothetical protein